MRRQSVAFFLGDVGFMADPKFRRLARRLSDADDFNSAVGAYFIALAAARRNGLPEIDVEAETDSRFVPDLVAVGLLEETGFPHKTFVAWAPSRPKRPGEVATSGDELRRSVTKGDERDGYDVPSTPLPSTPINSEDVATTRARENWDGRADLEAFVVIKRRPPTHRQRRLLDDVLDRHDLTGPAWAADVMFKHPDDPIGAVIEADKAWRQERIAAAQAAESPKPMPKRVRGMPTSTRELMADWAAQMKEPA